MYQPTISSQFKIDTNHLHQNLNSNPNSNPNSNLIPNILSHIHSNTLLTSLLQILGGSLLIALAAQIKIPLFFTPIPLSMQTFMIMLLGGFLGPRKGALCAILYLTELAAGLPFSASGLSNPLILIGPTGGYLFGMVAQAYMTGLLFEKGKNFSPITLLTSTIAISFLQMGIGTAWLSLFVGPNNAFFAGFAPFIFGDLIKCVAATTFISKSKTQQS